MRQVPQEKSIILLFRTHRMLRTPISLRKLQATSAGTWTCYENIQLLFYKSFKEKIEISEPPN